MTTQFPDRVLYRDHSWILAWTSGTGLFSPRQHCIEPAATCSAWVPMEPVLPSIFNERISYLPASPPGKPGSNC